MLDLLATDLNLDRIELRRRNLVADSQMPYPLASITPSDSSTELDSGDYHAVFDRCLAEFDWKNKEHYSALMDLLRRQAGAYGMGVEYAYTMVHHAPQSAQKPQVVPGHPTALPKAA